MTSEEIIKILEDKKATLPFPACGHDGFTLVDGDFAQELIASGAREPLGPAFHSPGVAFPFHRSINYIVLVCDNCGYIRQHAMKPLGITPKFRRG
jgi:hypothetical protein